MAVYAIGDIQGCFDSLQALLNQLDFKRERDQLIFAGDLVSRGPKSLETLRFAAALPSGNEAVLGNHDLHLLAMAHTPNDVPPSHHNKNPDLQRILNAPDAEALLEWLRHRPMAYYREDLASLVVHAAVHPDWDLDTLLERAHEVEELLRGPNIGTFLKEMYGDHPRFWFDHHQPFDRARYIVNLLTRTRYFDEQGGLSLEHKESPSAAPEYLIPWYELPRHLDPAIRVIFGHWSTLGYYQSSSVYGIDTGCLWGGKLTALRLDHELNGTPKPISIKCPQIREPL